MRLIFLVITWALIGFTLAGEPKDYEQNLQTLDELRQNLAKQEVSPQSKKLIELIFNDLSSLADDTSSKKQLKDQVVYETNVTSEQQAQHGVEYQNKLQQSEYVLQPQQTIPQQGLVEYQNEIHPQLLEYQSDSKPISILQPHFEYEQSPLQQLQPSQPYESAIEDQPPTVGTTPYFREIYLGRCHYFINVLHADTCFLRPYLEYKINCSQAYEEFVNVVVGKDSCEITVDDYSKYLNRVAHPIPAGKSLFYSGMLYESAHQSKHLFSSIFIYQI
jgi:hypothetical protein